MGMWRGYFYSWTEWVLTARPAELDQVSEDYTKLGNVKATWLLDFRQRLRNATAVQYSLFSLNT